MHQELVHIRAELPMQEEVMSSVSPVTLATDPAMSHTQGKRKQLLLLWTSYPLFFYISEVVAGWTSVHVQHAIPIS